MATKIKVGTWLAALLATTAGGTLAARAEEPLRIGLAAPLTGPYAPYSEANGAACMADMLNKAGAGPKVEVTIEDSRSDPQQTVAIGQKLLDEGNVIVSGTPFPDSLIPLSKLAESGGAFVFSAQITQVDMQAVGLTNFLQMAVPDDINASAGAEVAYSLGARKAVLLTSEDSGSWSAKTPLWFGEVFSGLGGEVVGQLNYSLGTSDWSPQITEIKAMNPQPDVVYICSAVPDVGILARQLNAAGFEGRLFGCDGFDDPSLEKTVGSNAALAKTFFATWAIVGVDNREADTFLQQCRDNGFKMNGLTDVSGGDLVRIAWQAAQQAGTTTDGLAIMAEIRNGQTFTGLMSTPEVSFKGDSVYPERTVPVIGFEDGKRVVIYEKIPAVKPASK